MTNVTPTQQPDLTGYTFGPRSISTRDYGFDVAITETTRKNGLHIRIQLEGITLTRKQEQQLARSLALWKYGLRSVEPEQASPFAQALGIPEYQFM